MSALLHRIHAAPSTGTRVDIGVVAWRPEGGTLEERREQGRRLVFVWNMAEGVPTHALEAGAVRDFYSAAIDLLEAVEGAGAFPELAAKLSAAYAAHHLDTTDGRLHDCPACTEAGE